MTRVKHTKCPWCFKRHDRVSGVAKKGTKVEPTAKDGDATFCVYCLQPSIFDSRAKYALRFPTEAEFEELKVDEIAGKMIRFMADQPKLREVKRFPEWSKRFT